MNPKSNLKHLLADTEVMNELRNVAATPAVAGAEARSAADEAVLKRIVEGDESAISLSSHYNQTEAIVLLTGRPPLLIQDGVWARPKLASIRQRLDLAKDALLKTIPKVGRVEVEGLGDYLGTGWMLDEATLITNRHVAREFAQRAGSTFTFRRDHDGDPYSARVDFLREHQRSAIAQARVTDILYLEEDGEVRPDMALVRLDKSSGNLPEPVELDAVNPAFDTDIAVIGYPAEDSRNDAIVMRDIFDGIYDVKRLSPGKVRGVDFDGKRILHDCSTLGGNSGSLLVNLVTGKVCGLHFAGSYRVNNYAVSVGWLKSRLREIGAQRLISLPPAAPAGGGGGAAPAGAGAGLVNPEPERTQSPQGRKGYNPQFLGEDFEVPVPEIPAELAGLIAPVKGNSDGELKYTHFSIYMRSDRQLPFYTACNIDGEKLFNFTRASDRWSLDGRLEDGTHQVGEELYASNPLDRGHLVRRLDPTWGETRAEAKQAEEDTFFFTNCSPQHSQLNQRTWLSLEDYILGNAGTHELKVNVFTGPVMADDDKEYRGVQLPREYWKVVVIRNTSTEQLSATAYLLSQKDLIRGLEEFVFGEFRTYQVPIQQIEEKTGLGFGDLKRYDPLNLSEGTPQREINGALDVVL